ncbi:oncostatin-M-specific receptor subunit beta [Candoia aspera]|uniref:oncostatin-M-specific receptor subunit beta n=1 Tax=Candoia aspera TaxID=51853 RepID=UPI002FD85CDC
MDHLIFHRTLLCVALCFGLFHNQGNQVFEPTNLRIYPNNSVQQLLLEWDVNDYSEAYNSEIKIIFNIQIRLKEEDRIILNVNHTTVLNKSRQHYQQRLFSDVPLECETHEARIRSKVTKIWSNWSDWRAANGPDALSGDKIYIFPEYKAVERGSNFTFCCIAKKNEYVTSFSIHNHRENVLTKQQRLIFTRNVTFSFPSRIQVACGFSNTLDNNSTYLYLTRQPDKPRNLSCETEDMINITCTWDPGNMESDNDVKSVCPAKFILSDTSSTKTYCSCIADCKNSCSFKMGHQSIYNVSLISKNCLGQKQEYLSFDVNYRVRPVVRSNLSVDDQNATFMQLSWRVKPINGNPLLLCQIHAAYAGGNKQYSITVQSNPDFHPHIKLGGLQPYTSYTLKVRCATAVDPFWKWSEWSQSILAKTPESAPSGLLDIWRIVNQSLEQRSVTIFWRELPGFRANGNIKTYDLFWENLEEPSVQRHNYSISAPQNCTTISLGSHSYKILVWARNAAFASSPSGIMIPATDKNGNVHYTDESTINNTADSIYISWKPQSKFNQYVVDWCNQPKYHPCDFQWMKFGQNDSNAFITSDAFRPGIRYTFSVYGMHGDKSCLLEKKVKYLKELEPTEYLSFNISTITADSLTVTWKRYDQEFNFGFIRGYVFYMKMNNQSCTVQGFEPFIHTDNQVICSYKIKKTNQTEFTVRQLEPSTTYLFALQAYTVKPEYIGSDNFTRATTQADSKSWFSHLLQLLVITPLVLIMCVCFWRSNCMRNCLYPAVPHPKVTPFLKMSPGIIDIHDTIPDQLVVLEKHQGSSGKQSTLGMIIMENLPYFQSTYYPELQMEERTNQKFNSGLTAYKPLQDFGFTSRPSTPQTKEHSKDNLNYLYRTELPPSMAQEMDSTSVHWKDYRPQCSTTS